MGPQISFSGHINGASRQLCENRLWQTYIEMPIGSRIMCHVSDRESEYSGALFIFLDDGKQLCAHSVADDPMDVVDDLIFNVEEQMKSQPYGVCEPIMEDSRVLIVDDDPESVALMKAVLKKLNQPCVYVQNPFEAIDRIVSGHYKLVIMDIFMPEIDGFQVIAQADNKIDQKMHLPFAHKSNFATFSGDTECHFSPSAFSQFNYIGHWKKQQSFGELRRLVEKALRDIEPTH